MRNRLTLLFILTACALQAQISDGGLPPSFIPENQPYFAGKPPASVSLPQVDSDQLMAEDSHTPGQTRFAAPVSADISPEHSGVWATLANGDRVWQCGITSTGAHGLCLLFDQFVLPAGAQVFAYTPDHKRVLGAYSQRSCLPSGKFLIGILPGESAILECRVPAAQESALKLHINRVDVAYDKHAMNDAEFDFSESLPCNVNINCPAGAGWQTEKKGIARILMVFQSGEAWCSGTLIANTSGSYDPYFLTAHHCQLLLPNPDFDVWRFDFEYESPDCNNPAQEPLPKSVLGCERVASWMETDFMLLKLNAIPPSYEVYFNGWNRSNADISLAPNTVMISHPFGDIKKITIDTQTAYIYAGTLNWGGAFGNSAPNTHWRTVPDIGIQQPGSSGGPLFDSAKRIRGQLHGGSVNPTDDCVMTGVYYGRFNMSWDQGGFNTRRLKDWLDPGNTSALYQNGYLRPVPTGFTIAGVVKTHWGAPMPNLVVRLTDANGSALTALTDTSGHYAFNNVTAGHNYTLKPERDSNDLNGLTTYDMVLVSKHILGIQALDSPWKIIAADVNGSNGVSSGDIVVARKVLLGINSSFQSNTSWRFFPDYLTFPDPTNPFDNPLPPGSISITNLQADYLNGNFKGIKVGDVNNTSDPKY